MLPEEDLSGLGLARLMRLAFDGVPLTPIAEKLIARAVDRPDDADALMNLSIVLQLHGLKAEGLTVQACALRTKRLYRRPAALQPALHLLALMAPGDLMTNTPLEFLIEGSDVALSTLYLKSGEALPEVLPDHDVLMVCASESDRNRDLLERLALQIPLWGVPVLNRPECIVRTSRTLAHACLRGAHGVVIPACLRVARSELERLGCSPDSLQAALADAEFPLIVRPVDSHAGRGLAKVDDAKGLQGYLAAEAAEDFFVSSFVDYRSPDGWYRKFRVVLVEGQAFPAHMAVSSHWMIHYLNAGMTECAQKRAEEQAFMTGFERGFWHRHRQALHEISARFGLDYLVIDCAETAEGRLLVFEVDPGAVVHSMDSPALFPYKRDPMNEIFAAFRRMLSRRAPTSKARAKLGLPVRTVNAPEGGPGAIAGGLAHPA